MKKVLLLALVFVLLVLPALPAGAQAPTSQQIPFSGTAPGQPDGSTDLTFNLFDAATGGIFLGYSDSQVGVPVAAEAFSAVLGAGTGGAVSAGTFAANLSVFIAIELTSTPGVEIAPRVPLFSSGYAQFALTGGSGTITGVTAGSGLTGGGTSGTVTLSADLAGTGIANSVARSDHNHDAQYSQLGHTHAGSDITSPVATANNALAIADNTVTSAKIVDGSIAAVDVNAAQVQLRVTGSCTGANAIQVVNQAGTVGCVSTGTVGGSGTANSVPKFTAATTLGNSAISEVGGNVGVGTTSPADRLHVIGTGTAIRATDAGVSTRLFSASSTGTGYVGTATNHPFILRTNDTDRVTIGAQGNVGIGTTAPTARLHVAGGNVNLDNSTATAGNILKGGVPFIHNFGADNTFIGLNAGNLTMTGFSNTASGVSALQNNTTGRFNTASGISALQNNATGSFNTASGRNALQNNTTGSANTASGDRALQNNITGEGNTAIGFNAGVPFGSGNLTNATAIGAGALVNASNKVRIGDTNVTVIEGQVGFTASSDRNQKENFQPVDGEEVLEKIRGLSLTSWNFIGHDPKQFRHYGPVAQDFFAAFGNDGIGIIGTPTTITSTDMAGILMIAVQTLEKRTGELRQENNLLKETVETFKAENTDLKARLEALERLVLAKEALAQK